MEQEDILTDSIEISSSSSISSFDYDKNDNNDNNIDELLLIKTDEEYFNNYNKETENENLLTTQSDYDNNLKEKNDRIICIELMNNNKIYLNYESNWSIRDLISQIYTHKEFLKLYNNKSYSYNMLNNIFDLNLTIFRSIKEDINSKIDLDIKIAELVEMGLLKSHFPLLFLLDSRNFYKISKQENYLENSYNTIINNFDILKHSDLIYKNYLPRNYINYINNNNEEMITNYKNNSKKANVFQKLELDPIIINEKSDWFIYDDESLNFLKNMENLNNDNLYENIKIIKNASIKNNQNSIILFQDKLPYILLSNQEYKIIFINIFVNDEIKIKIDAKLNSTPNELLKKINCKLKIPRPELVFDCSKKILKVKNLCDYFFEMEQPIGFSAYITECFKKEIIPELIIFDNPLLLIEKKLNRRRSSSFNSLKDDLISKRNVFTNVQYGTINNRMKNASIIKNSSFKNKKFSDADLYNNKIINKISDNKVVINDLKTEIKKPTTFVKENDFKNEIKNRKINIANIGIFNPDLIKFSELKGYRRRAFIIKDDVKNTKKNIKNNKNNLLDFNELIKTSIQNSIQKYENENNKINAENKQIEVDVDNLILEKRRRTKAIKSDRSSTPVRISGNSITRKYSSTNNENIPNNNSSTNLKLNDLKLEEYFNQMNSNISNLNILKPFNVTIRMIKINYDFLKEFEIYYSKNEIGNEYKILNLEIEVQIFCGNESITNIYKIPTKIIQNENKQKDNDFIIANFNEKINFDINYRDLPLFSSIIFKIKTNIKNPQKDKKVEKKTIAWVNFRIFDHLKRMKTGLHKNSLWGSKFQDDSYFIKIENNTNTTGEIFFQLETFIRPIEHQNINEEINIFRPQLTSISAKDQIIINKINKQSPFEELNNIEKEVLWRNKNLLCQKPEYIVKILSNIDKRNINKIYELEKLILTCKPVPPIQALQLLSGNFLFDSIRKFAVYSLQQVSYLELTKYLPQIIQSIKYEVYHDSPLANFLLKLAIKYPLTIGHNLFWNFKSEMANPNVQQRFGLYLEVFLNKIGPDLRKLFEDEVWLLKNLYKIKNLEDLYKINEEIKKFDKIIHIPYNFKLMIKGIKCEKCKFMKSKKKPLWLVFENLEGEDIYVMFKKGDDLRQDVLTIQLFDIMNTLWFDEDIKLKMSLYNVISTGYFEGLLQIVTNSETLATIHKEFGCGLTLGFSDKPLKNWMLKNIKNITEKEYVENFLVSNAAYCVATFVLGIGDRHNDNIMVKKNGELFHIDFGHFLGHFKYKFGIKRERAPFVFTTEFLNVLGGEKSEKCYMILRENSEVLITILKIMLCTGIPELTHNSIKFLEYSLALKMNDKDAEIFLLKKLDDSLNSFSTKLNFAFHIIAN